MPFSMYAAMRVQALSDFSHGSSGGLSHGSSGGLSPAAKTLSSGLLAGTILGLSGPLGWIVTGSVLHDTRDYPFAARRRPLPRVE